MNSYGKIHFLTQKTIIIIGRRVGALTLMDCVESDEESTASITLIPHDSASDNEEENTLLVFWVIP